MSGNIEGCLEMYDSKQGYVGIFTEVFIYIYIHMCL